MQKYRCLEKLRCLGNKGSGVQVSGVQGEEFRCLEYMVQPSRIWSRGTDVWITECA